MHRLFLAALLAVLPLTSGLAATPPPRTLSGRVADPGGRPLFQARVTVLEANRSALTDLEGRFEVVGLPSGTYGVSFSAIGYAPLVRRVTLDEEDVVPEVELKPSLVELPDLQVTAAPVATTSLASPQPVSVLGGADLEASRSATLGETVSTLPGVRSLSTGAGVGKPVIRGLSSNRVLVLADGERVESQQWGDEHGPQVEAVDAERIEVIRGPASVLYGSDALGGVINVVTPPLPDAQGREPFANGRAVASYSTNNEQPDGTLAFEGAAGGFGFRTSLTGRTSDDVGTPAGPLFNSGLWTVNGSGTVGYRGGWGSVSASYVRRDERVEIHEDPAEEPGATPFQRIGDDRLHLSGSLPVGLSHLDIDLGIGRNRRREFESDDSDEVALGLLSRTYSADVRLHHAPVGAVGGIVGLSALRNSFEKFGEETLIPNNAYNNLGVYAFEQAEIGRWNLSIGARYDYRRLTVEDDTVLGVAAQRRTYHSATGNLGALYRVAEPLALVFNLGRGYRSPTAYDLFSNGVHEGTVRFERGDPSLENETSVNADLAVRVQTSALSAELGAFANYIDNFIFPDPTEEVDPASGFQIFDITQGNARLSGFEAAVEYHPSEWLHVRGTADYTRGRNRSTDAPLPFIPPFRATYSVKLEGGDGEVLQHPYFSIGGESNARQTDLDPEDFAPPGYTLVHLGAGAVIPLGARTFAVDFQLRNALDKAYANFLSRYKTYALDPGRNFILRVSAAF
ncbi:MAG TPA: TonB-dependent receptor [Gemmatimonadales bacterium]|nr:TonB-dependent receptor [Gemmatimonadales bacterium]